jgi:hypothetical protein
MPTPLFNLPLYDDTDTAELDTLLNGQSVALETALAGNIRYFARPDAERLDHTAVDGDTWYASDTKITWLYDGGWEPIASAGTSYTPVWAAAASNPSIGNGSLTGFHQYIARGLSFIYLRLLFGSTTTGGAGVWTFTMPPDVPAAPIEQEISMKAYQSPINRRYAGFAEILPGSPTLLRPVLPVGPTVSDLTNAQNANNAGAGGTGVPVVTSAYSYGSGSSLVIQGIVRTA